MGIGVVVVAATIVAGYIVLPAAAWGFLRLLTAILSACIWLASALVSGEDGWTIVRSVARAAALSLITPRVSGIIALLVLLGAASLYGLQRLLGIEEEEEKK